MLKKKLMILMVIPALLLAGCASLAPAASTSNQAAQNGQAAPNIANQPIEGKLAVGLLKLEDSDKALSSDQAKTLLPLWKAVKTLSASSTASADEISALYTQIQEALTADQIQAVKDLALTPADTQALMTQYGVQMPQGAAPSQSSTRPAGSTSAQGGFPGGDLGGGPGGPPPDGGGFPGGQPSAQGTPPAGAPPRAARAGGSGMNLLFVDPLIKLLETKAGS